MCVCVNVLSCLYQFATTVQYASPSSKCESTEASCQVQIVLLFYTCVSGSVVCGERRWIISLQFPLSVLRRPGLISRASGRPRSLGPSSKICLQTHRVENVEKSRDLETCWHTMCGCCCWCCAVIEGGEAETTIATTCMRALSCKNTRILKSRARTCTNHWTVVTNATNWLENNSLDESDEYINFHKKLILWWSPHIYARNPAYWMTAKCVHMCRHKYVSWYVHDKPRKQTNSHLYSYV